MATTIKLKNGSGAPLAGDLVQGEPAFDLTNKRLYTENASGTVIEVGTNPTSLTTGTFTSTGIDDNATSTKLTVSDTGIDVTGTITTDGLNFDVADGVEIDALESILFNIDSDNNQTGRVFGVRTNSADTLFTIQDTGNVGIGTTSPDGTLHVKDAVAQVYIQSNDGQPAQIVFGDASDASRGRISYDSSDNIIFENNNLTERMRIDSSGNVGIGTTSPSTYTNAPELVIDTGTAGGITVKSGTAGYGAVFFADGTSGNEQYRGFIQYNHNFAGAVDSLILGSAGTERMRIDSSGNVGIGTTSPSTILANVSASAKGLAIESAVPAIAFKDTSATDDVGYIYQSTNNLHFLNYAGGDTIFSYGSSYTDAMRIDSVGRLLLGQSANVSGFALQLQGSGGSGGDLSLTSDSSKAEIQSFSNKPLHINRQGNNTILNEGSGNVGIGTSSPSRLLTLSDTGATLLSLVSTDDDNCQLLFGDSASDTVGKILYRHSSNSMAFETNAAEAMRINSSGNLLVGKTSTAFGTAGVEASAGNGLWSTRSGLPALALNRLSTDGSIADFYKDGTTVGSIGTSGGTTYIGGYQNAGLYFNGTTDFRPWNTSTQANLDNSVDLGSSSARFDDIYATNGTIQTSDVNEKQDIEALSEAETRVAVAAKGLLRKFRWKSSVEEKGDDARIHFGIIAQDLQAAFEAEGLDAGRYGMFIHSTWTDEETGEERSRMGVRYSELLAFIIAAI